MRRFHKQLSDIRQRIAKERIEILFELSKKNLAKNPERSKKYIELARKIGKRYNIRLKKEQKRTFCKNCNQLLLSTKTAEVIMDPKSKLEIVKCKGCNKIYRYFQ